MTPGSCGARRRGPGRRLCSGLIFLLVAACILASRPSAAAPGDSATGPAGVGAAAGLAERAHREVEAIEPWLERYGAGAVFGAVFVEGVGVPAPGLTLLVAGAFLSAAGRGPGIGVILACAFLAAALGNSLGYAAGRLGGRPLLRRLRVKDRRLRKLERGFSEYGGWVIVGARFLEGLKQLNGIAAGVLGMPWRAFSLFNVLGAGLWVCLFGLGAYGVGEHLPAARALLRYIYPWAAAGAGVMLALVLWQLLERRGAVGRP